uniref:Putative ovule protein n=1 Tax=Solanum chacoense TaxID=4108 RepID=A0A0V0GZX4_SOLCH
MSSPAVAAGSKSNRSVRVRCFNIKDSVAKYRFVMMVYCSFNFPKVFFKKYACELQTPNLTQVSANR